MNSILRIPAAVLRIRHLHAYLAFALFTSSVLDVHSQASQPPTPAGSQGPCGTACAFLTMSGGSANSRGACSTTLHVPCQKEAWAFTFINSSNPCPEPFVIESPSTDCSWSISALGGGRADGLSIQSQGKHLYSCSALITVTTESVLPGTYLVTAEPTVGPPRIGYVNVEKEQCSTEGGCETPGAEIGQALAREGSVAATVKLGKYAFGKSVGGLSLHEKYPSNMIAKPCCLGFLYPSGTNNAECELITNSIGIRQVKVPEGLANVVTNTDYKYSISIYSPSVVSSTKDGNGLYTFSGGPLSTITVENPDGATSTNKIRITDGDGFVSNYEWKTNGWELVQGGGLRTQYKTTTLTNNVRTTVTDTRGTNDSITRAVRKYQVFGFGERLIEESSGIGTNSLTNSFQYHTNASLITTGMLRQATYADGRWKIYEYNTNGFRTNAYYGYQNQDPTTNNTLARTFQLQYGDQVATGAGDLVYRHLAEPRCVIESVLGKEVGRYYKLYYPSEVRYIRCINPGALWNDSSNLVTTTKYYSDSANSNRLKSIESPDGTMEIRQYSRYTNGLGDIYQTNTVLIGAPDAGKTTIVDGNKTISVVGRPGQLFSRTVIDVASGITNSLELYSDHDAYNRPRKVTYLDGTFEWTDNGCCGPVNVTNREGTVISHLRDPLNRKAAVKQGGITLTNAMDAAGRVLTTARIGTNGNAIVQASYAYDSVGNRIALTNALGQVTRYAETNTNYQITRITTHPDGGTRIEKYYRDGQLERVTGTAVRPVRYEYGVEQDNGIWRPFTKEIRLDGTDSDTAEWVKTYRDMVGRTYKIAYPDGASMQSFYNTKGQLAKEVDPDGVTKLFAYDAKGLRNMTAIDMDRDGNIDTNGTDRITEISVTSTNIGSRDLQQTRSYAWITNNSSVANRVSESRTSTDGKTTWQVSYSGVSAVTNRTDITLSGTGNRYVTNTAPDGSFAVTAFRDGRLLAAIQNDVAGNQLGQIVYTYDEHGRQLTISDSSRGVTAFAYTDLDQVSSVTTGVPGTGQAAQTASYVRDYRGRITRTLLADGGIITNIYSLKGELLTNVGSRIYPVGYGYDAQGRRTRMITWKNFATQSGAATTTWNYDTNRGFLISKVYDDGKGTTNLYTLSGRLRTRTWARGVSTTYGTNAAGETIGITYSDGTSNVTYNLDRQGRRTNMVDGVGSRYFTHSDAGLVLMETNASGPLTGISLGYGYDSNFRRTTLTLRSNATTLRSHSYLYGSTFSRITNVSDGTYSAGYSYLDNTSLISQITFRSNSTMRMTTTKAYDKLNRLLSISSQPSVSGEAAISFAYSYNDANQRTRVNHADGSYWLYEYDRLGQLTSGKHYWPDNAPVAGQQFEYAYDDIGNRQYTKSGGDSQGNGLRFAGYSANLLNQYVTRDVPSAVDVIGSANPSASVTVNALNTSRKDEYFSKELSIGNTVGAVWTNLAIIASLGGTNQTNSGNLFLAKSYEGYTYDADGNLTSDGRWTNKWDGENRLIQSESLPSAPTASKRKVVFEYDGGGRVTRRLEYDGSSGSYLLTNDLKFVRDGWQLIAEINGVNGQTLRSYLWGLDVSGSLNEAGGVGGLLAMNSATAGVHFYVMDGNGNVAGLVSATNGTRTVNEEYDPFGRTLRITGAAATENQFHFSTKRGDETLELVAYEYRAYNSSAGRWLSRDPIGEKGGANEFGMAGNNLIDHIDILGKDFIAVAGRSVRGTLDTFGHYSLQRWKSCGTDAPEEQYNIDYWTRNHPASKAESVELLASPGWFVGTLAPTPGVRSTSVSVVSIGPPFMDSATSFVSVFKGSSAEVKARWSVVRFLAENYQFAEQGGPLFEGPFVHWPDSKYGFPHDGPFNNSNTFVRDTTQLAGLLMRELIHIPGGFPGNDVPVSVPDIYVSFPSR